MSDAALFRYESSFHIHGVKFMGDETDKPDFGRVAPHLLAFIKGLWRHTDSCEINTGQDSGINVCPYCAQHLEYLSTDRFRETRRGWGPFLRHSGSPVEYTIGPDGFTICQTCGFWYVAENVLGLALEDHYRWDIATMRHFDINDPQVGLIEVATHLSRTVSDLYALTSSRFEELVAQVYRDLGYHVRLTQKSRDGGYDLILLEGSGARQTIVECKRYGLKKPITVGIVREVLGVQLALGVPKAQIVASTYFTKPAVRAAKKVSAGHSGYELELVDIQRLTEMLGVYAHTGSSLVYDPRFPKTRGEAGLY